MRIVSFFFLCIITAFFIFPKYILAQDTRVENVRFQDMGETIFIQYDLQGRIDKKYKISIALSDDNGLSFRIKPQNVAGDVGKNIIPGKGKKITWYIKQDIRGGLSGSGFIFAVDAELQKSGSILPYILGGGGIVAGIVILLKPRPETTKQTSILIDVPKSF